MFFVQFSLIFYLICLSISAPLPKDMYSELRSTKVLNFMKTFGYIHDDGGESEAQYSEEGISKIIKTVQRFGGIEQTGKIDNATLKLMSSRRCGVRDVIPNKRQKRFILGSDGWQKREITYFVANWSPKLGEYLVVKNIQRALDTWGGYGRLNFRRTQNPDADIIVAFGSQFHGDQYPFDGPGLILAHAFFPYESSDLGGDIHFDADENWIDQKEHNTQDGTDFYTVALHELGHSLGLAHSDVPSSVMFPYYKGTESGSEFQLDYDDILGMYQLYISKALQEDNNAPSTTTEDIYGASSTTLTNTPVTEEWSRIPTTEYSPVTSRTYPITTDNPSTTTEDSYQPTVNATETVVTYEGDDETVDDHKKHDEKHNIPRTSSPSLPNICYGHVDALATLREELFVFKEKYVWRYKEKGKLEPGYPVPLTQMFPKLPKSIKKIDAVYQRPDGMIVLFTGDKFWVYNGVQFSEDSPRPLTDYGLPNYLRSIDTIQTWGRNRKTYIYKNERFWRYNELEETMDEGYPLHMERWRGIPENLDAATTWKDGNTYFFKGELFWKFDNDWIYATEESPMPTAQVWFGCPEDEHQMRRLFS